MAANLRRVADPPPLFLCTPGTGSAILRDRASGTREPPRSFLRAAGDGNTPDALFSDADVVVVLPHNHGQESLLYATIMHIALPQPSTTVAARRVNTIGEHGGEDAPCSAWMPTVPRFGLVELLKGSRQSSKGSNYKVPMRCCFMYSRKYPPHLFIHTEALKVRGQDYFSFLAA